MRFQTFWWSLAFVMHVCESFTINTELAEFDYWPLNEDLIRANAVFMDGHNVSYYLKRVETLYSNDQSARHTFSSSIGEDGSWAVLTTFNGGRTAALITQDSNNDKVMEIRHRELISSVDIRRQLENARFTKNGYVSFQTSGMLEGCETRSIPKFAIGSSGRSSTHGLKLERQKGFILDNYNKNSHPVHPRHLADAFAFFPQCYVGDDRTHTLIVGLASDLSFFRAHGSDLDRVTAEIELAVAASSNIYRLQFNLELKIGQLRIATDNDSWTDTNPIFRYDGSTCPAKMATILDRFSEYVGSLDVESEQVGLWHFLTNCKSIDGNLGLSYVDAICVFGFNTGVSTYTGNLWRTLVHEFGHGIGAQHSFENGVGRTGGLMDYGDGKILNTELYRFRFARKKEMCDGLEMAKMSKCPYFKVKPALSANCGDRFLSNEEECECVDGSTECDGCQDCLLTSPQLECSVNILYLHHPHKHVDGGTLSHDECCDIHGRFQPATVSCKDGNGFCSFGQCVDKCKLFGLSSCGQERGGCRSKCLYEAANICSASFVDDKGAFIGNMDVGTRCDLGEGKAGICDGTGSCVPEETAPPSPIIIRTRSPTTTSSPTVSPTTLGPTTSPTTMAPTTSPTLGPTMVPSMVPTKGSELDFVTRGWSRKLGNQGQSCTTPESGVVRYGTKSKFLFQTFDTKQRFKCVNAVFGGDPYPLRRKECRFKPMRWEWVYLAREGGRIVLETDALVRYGVQDKFVHKVLRSGTVFMCTNQYFERDPLPYRTKYCHAQSLD